MSSETGLKNVHQLDERRAADEVLWRAFQRGDRQAAEEVWKREARWIQQMFLHVLGARIRDDVEDLTQEVFIIIQKQLPTLDLGRPVRLYLTGIVMNLAHQRLRSWRRKARFLEALPHAIRAPWVEPVDPSLPQAVAELNSALDRLDPELRLAFTLRFIQKQTLEEVAESLELSLATAKRRLRAARLELQALAPRYPTLSTFLSGAADDDAAS